MMESERVSGAATYTSAIEQANNYTRWVLTAFHAYLGQRLLEIGFGHGSYADHLPELVDYVGIDIDADCVAHARAHHPHRDYYVADIVASDIPSIIGQRTLDTVLCCNVLEHIEQDGLAMKNLLSVLRPGGHLLVFVPALQSLYSSLDSMAGHYRRYSRTAIAALVPEGSRVVCNEYFNPIGGIGWWVNKFLQHQSLNDQAVNWQVRAFDRFVLPFSRALNPLTRSFFGQSLVLVVRKTTG